MANRGKIACSVDSRLLASVESLRARTGESRSAVINRALEALLASQDQAERVQRYVEAYREYPERPVEVVAARRHARQLLARLPWDDE